MAAKIYIANSCNEGWTAPIAFNSTRTALAPIKLGCLSSTPSLSYKGRELLETTGVLHETTGVLMQGCWVLQVRITARVGAIFTSCTL